MTTTRTPLTPASPFFFFQAEDGIRDGRVTGVQTCALPIFACRSAVVVARARAAAAARTVGHRAARTATDRRSRNGRRAEAATAAAHRVRADCEIGRASCRERV